MPSSLYAPFWSSPVGKSPKRCRFFQQIQPLFLLHTGCSYWKNGITASSRHFSSLAQRHRYAVLGAGFAGLSVAWHLLEHSHKEAPLHIDIYDEIGIGGGASGVSGGLLHPYTPKVKLLWRGAECWDESLKLLTIAEKAKALRAMNWETQDSMHVFDEPIVWRRGILRPVTDTKNESILRENAQDCHGSCRVEFIDKDAALNLVPGLNLPLNSAVYMPEAVNIHPGRYLEALFLACQNQAKDLSASGYPRKEIYLQKKAVNNLFELSGGEYSAVVICLGAKADMLPELTGKLPLRKCRGVVTHLQLPNELGGYGECSPSILSNVWLAIQGPHHLAMGATWEWGSSNYSSSVLPQEANSALDELLSKASPVYPSIMNWSFACSKAGVRSMPPLTPLGSLPLLGCVDDVVGGKNARCRYWLMGGLGSRGLLYHGWLGKFMAQAVLSSDETVLPSELTSWKNMKVTRKP